jgi:hypothetical protein
LGGRGEEARTELRGGAQMAADGNSAPAREGRNTTAFIGATLSWRGSSRVGEEPRRGMGAAWHQHTAESRVGPIRDLFQSAYISIF